jgi:hypothetical protein
MNLLILNENVNRDYRLPLEIPYVRRISENHEYRKLALKKASTSVFANPLILQKTTFHLMVELAGQS